MSIKVNIPSYLKSYTNDAQVVEVNGSTVKECLDRLVEQFPSMKKMVFTKDGRLLDYVSIYVGGEFAYADELAQPVKDEDELHLLYILGGG